MTGTQHTKRLLKIETRLPEVTVGQLKVLAAANRRSVAAEVRVAVERRIEEAA